MVNITRALLRRKTVSKWVDSLRVYAKGGHGGNGLPKVGGIGGRGGNVVVVPSTDVKDLYQVFKREFQGSSNAQRITAGSGYPAAANKILGEPGDDVVLKVPIGIQIIDDQSRLLADLNDEKLRVNIALGGNGGCPANSWLGQRGQRRHVRLDLKLIADYGLVGFPNAGKSTLLKAISRAKPKIASYPFTTVKPNLAVVEYPRDLRRLTMADLPGLIEGASRNVGMGHRFLKHIERTRVLLFVIDIDGFRLNENSAFRTAFETIVLLNRELESYNPDLTEKPAVCLVNKMDSDGAEEKYRDLMDRLADYDNNAQSVFEGDESLTPTKFVSFSEVIPLSAKFSAKSVSKVKERLRERLDDVDDRERSDKDEIRDLEVVKREIDEKLGKLK